LDEAKRLNDLNGLNKLSIRDRLGNFHLARDREREHLDVVRSLLTHKVEDEASVSNTDP